MALWTGEEIAAATGGQLSEPFAVDGVAFDSREISDGDLFVAMKGESDDGHRFVAQAYRQGAGGAIVSEPVEGPHVLASDTARALRDLGMAARARGAAKIIGVTGSVGKTGTKEALFAALDRLSFGAAHRSVKSYNNHVGVPLSLARMPRDAAFGVFEMGMNHAGELAELTRQVRPDVAIVTAIAPAHIGHFRDETQIADAKAEIFEGLGGNGTAIVPFDSEHFARLKQAAAISADRIVSFGFGDGADVRAIDVVDAPGGGSQVRAELHGRSLSFTIAEPGRHWVSNALAILAAVDALDGDLGVAGLALAELEGLPGRGARHRVPAGNGTALVIDESYNANPVSMKAALKQFAREPLQGKRIAVLGAMGELGDASPGYHAALGDDIRAASCDHVILVGDDMAHTFAALQQDGLDEAATIVHARDADDAIERARSLIGAGDILLVKGSNYLKLDRLVCHLTREEHA